MVTKYIHKLNMLLFIVLYWLKSQELLRYVSIVSGTLTNIFFCINLLVGGNRYPIAFILWNWNGCQTKIMFANYLNIQMIMNRSAPISQAWYFIAEFHWVISVKTLKNKTLQLLYMDSLYSTMESAACKCHEQNCFVHSKIKYYLFKF